ncbi:MAG: hypothetical protein IPK52_24765 [Chloroflexi bacterium]|nr:hypothetical protein [Chloroflexota bacterium]
MSGFRFAREMVETLRACELFAALGQRNSDDVEYAPHWESAIQSCLSDEWLNTGLDARGDVTSKLSVLQISTGQNYPWNEIVRAIERDSSDLVYVNSWRCWDFGDVPDELLLRVKGSIVVMCVVAEYPSLRPPFFDTLHHWYLKGHLPCGWAGKYPQGRLIVF